jgi:hypothetical protein
MGQKPTHDLLEESAVPRANYILKAQFNEKESIDAINKLIKQKIKEQIAREK